MKLPIPEKTSRWFRAILLGGATFIGALGEAALGPVRTVLEILGGLF